LDVASALMLQARRLEFVQGDITQQDLEAIVNAANSRLAGGGGVDGAIHRAGGPAIMAELQAKYPQGCPTGEAVLTSGGRLKAKYVLHAVGPVYSGLPASLRSAQASRHKDTELLAGAYRYPVEEAAPTALRTVADYLRTHPEIELVRFVLFDSATYTTYRQALEALQERFASCDRP
jgi:O-acetyl-ADP-ribose deacetylase (regulator of RNase III)